MEQIFNWVSINYALTIMIALGVFTLVLLMLIIIIYRLNKVTKRYNTLVKGVEGKNMEELIIEEGKILENILLKMEFFGSRLKLVEEISKNSIQKVGLVRFNAFDDAGGNLSYALALLNEEEDGVILTSLLSRNDARTYCKPLIKGNSDFSLSDEEKKAIIIAVKGDNK